jgi:hypothetical protein
LAHAGDRFRPGGLFFKFSDNILQHPRTGIHGTYPLLVSIGAIFAPENLYGDALSRGIFGIKHKKPGYAEFEVSAEPSRIAAASFLKDRFDPYKVRYRTESKA